MFFKIIDAFFNFLMLLYGLAFRLICQEFTDFLVLWSIGQGVNVFDGSLDSLLRRDYADCTRYGFDGLLLSLVSNMSIIGIKNVAFVSKYRLDNSLRHTSFRAMGGKTVAQRVKSVDSDGS